MSRVWPLLLASLVVLSTAAGARAQAPCPAGVTACSTIPFVQTYATSGLSTIDFDTGYVPGGSPLQIRASLHVGGSTTVRMVSTEGVYWQPAIRAAFLDQPGGTLTIDYGFEVHLWVKFDILGIGWEGEIPIPILPSDLRLSQTVAIDDLVLPGATPRPVSVSDVTSRIRVLSYDLLSILSALGVGGGVALDVDGMLSATYATDRIRIDRAPVPITSEGGVSVIYPAGTGSNYGPSLDVVAHAEGTMSHVGTVHLLPTVFVKLLGQTFNLDVADIPINLVRTTRNVVFSPVTHHVPLPDVRIDVLREEFGTVTVGDAPTLPLVVHNDGSAPLDVEVISASSVFGVSQVGFFTIAPRSSFDLAPTFHAIVPGSFVDTVTIRTNDPDSPQRVVTLAGSATLQIAMPDGGPLADAGLSDGGVTVDPNHVYPSSCGCTVAGAARSPTDGVRALLAAALAALALAARRARR